MTRPFDDENNESNRNCLSIRYDCLRLLWAPFGSDHNLAYTVGETTINGRKRECALTDVQALSCSFEDRSARLD